MSESGVKSHIQMPRCVLKRFENAKNHLYYYDVEHDFIGTNGHAKSINRQQDYYSADVERYLSDNVEQPFSKVLQFVENVDFDADSFYVNNEFDKSVKTFVHSLFARDPQLLAVIQRKSVFFQFLSEQTRHNFAAIEGMNIAREKGLFSDYVATFTVNKTNTPFVLPICGLYSYK